MFPLQKEQQSKPNRPMTAKTIKSDAMTESCEFPLPNHLRKYVIGTNGVHIKKIQTDTSSRLDFSDEKLIIRSTSNENIEKAFRMVLNELSNFGWIYDKQRQCFHERNVTDELFAKYRAKADKEHKLMVECLEQSQKLFKNGQKKEAKEMSDRGRLHETNRNVLQKEAANQIFNELNKNLDSNTIDLHGLFVEEAIEFLESRLSSLPMGSQLNVITGAGRHSETNAKIKKAIEKLLTLKKYNFIQGNDGLFIVTKSL
jgi:DNA-nicking Smr family endonuclease